MERYTPESGDRQPLPVRARDVIQQAVMEIDRLDDDGAEIVLTSVNTVLNEERMVGAPVTLYSKRALILEEYVDESGMLLHQPTDPEVFFREEFTGTFTGCETYVQEEKEQRHLTYTLSFEKDDRVYVVSAPVATARLWMAGALNEDLVGVGDTTLDVEQEDDDVDVEQEVAAAFEVLQAADDQEYVQIARMLQEVYEDDTIPELVHRLRAIALCATALLGFPAHVAEKERAYALHTILCASLDADAEYYLTGVAAEEQFDLETSASALQCDTHPTAERCVLENVLYMTDFELQESPAGYHCLPQADGLQPAFRVLTDDGRMVVYPMKHLLSCDEYRPGISCEEFTNRMRNDDERTL